MLPFQDLFVTVTPSQDLHLHKLVMVQGNQKPSTLTVKNDNGEYSVFSLYALKEKSEEKLEKNPLTTFNFSNTEKEKDFILNGRYLLVILKSINETYVKRFKSFKDYEKFLDKHNKEQIIIDLANDDSFLFFY